MAALPPVIPAQAGTHCRGGAGRGATAAAARERKRGGGNGSPPSRGWRQYFRNFVALHDLSVGV